MMLLRACLLLTLMFPLPCVSSVDNATALVKHLLADYLPGLPPKGQQVEVELGLIEFTKISTTEEVLEMFVWWRMYWVDERLSWGPEWGVDSIPLLTSQVWSPDIIMYEAKEIEDQGISQVIASPSGSAYIAIRRKIAVGCSMKLAAFPYDTQRCNFTIGSWAFSANQLDVAPKKIVATNVFEDSPTIAHRNLIDLDQYKGPQGWTLAGVNVIWQNLTYNCCPDSPFAVLQVEFELRRSTRTYTTGMILPLIIVTCIGVSSLWMPSPLSGARPALSVTVLLTTTTVYFVASSSTPNSNDSTSIGRMYLFCLSMSFILVLTSIITTALNLIQPEDEISTRHFMHFFHFFDKSKSGTLNEDELCDALCHLGLNEKEQDAVREHFIAEGEGEVTAEQWKAFGELTKKDDDLVVYHNGLIRTMVVKKIELDLRQHGTNLGKQFSAKDVQPGTGYFNIKAIQNRLQRTLSLAQRPATQNLARSDSGNGVEARILGEGVVSHFGARPRSAARFSKNTRTSTETQSIRSGPYASGGRRASDPNVDSGPHHARFALGSNGRALGSGGGTASGSQASRPLSHGTHGTDSASGRAESRAGLNSHQAKSNVGAHGGGGEEEQSDELSLSVGDWQEIGQRHEERFSVEESANVRQVPMERLASDGNTGSVRHDILPNGQAAVSTRHSHQPQRTDSRLILRAGSERVEEGGLSDGGEEGSGGGAKRAHDADCADVDAALVMRGRSDTRAISENRGSAGTMRNLLQVPFRGLTGSNSSTDLSHSYERKGLLGGQSFRQRHSIALWNSNSKHFKSASYKMGKMLDSQRQVQTSAQKEGRYLSGWIDKILRRLLPLTYIVYLIFESVGLFSDGDATLTLYKSYGYTSPSGETKVKIDFLDYRSSGDGGLECYRSFPKTKRRINGFDSAIVDKCLSKI